jgi:CDP-diacylglycerol--glycerol-3-phosphate 3-phosphatidyltransferase
MSGKPIENNPADSLTSRRSFILVQGITLTRIPLAMAFAVVLLKFSPSDSTLIACVLLLAAMETTDFFDGILARHYSVRSEFGSMLDPYADSLARIIVYWALAGAGLVLYLVPLCMAIRDITVAYCRVIFTKHGYSVSARWSGKVKAGFQGIGAIIITLGPVYWEWTGEGIVTVFSWILIVVTLGSMVEYGKAAFPKAFGMDRTEKKS